MYDLATTATDLFRLGWKVGHLYTRRVLAAQQAFLREAHDAAADGLQAVAAGGAAAWPAYVTDSVQRSVLFWDTLRQRGNNFIEHERAGKPPVLVFDYETVV